MFGGLGVFVRRAASGLPLSGYVGLLLSGALAACVWLTPHHRPDAALLATGALATVVLGVLHGRTQPALDARPAGGSTIHVSMAVLAGPPGLLASRWAESVVLTAHRMPGWCRVGLDTAAGTLAGLAGWGVYSGMGRTPGPRGLVLAAAGAAAVCGYEVVVTVLEAGTRHGFRHRLLEQRSRWLLGLEMGCGVPLVVLGAQAFGAGAIALATGSLIGLHMVARSFLGAQARLSATEHRLARIVATAPLLVFATDPAGTITLAEGSPAHALALRWGGLLGRRVAELPEVGPGLIPVVGRALTGAAARTTVPMGDSVLDVHMSPLEERAGAVSGSLGVAIDVTEEQRSEVSRRARVRIADAVHGDPLPLLALATAELGALADELVDADARRIAERARVRLAAATAQLQVAVLQDTEPLTCSPWSTNVQLHSTLGAALRSAFADTDVAGHLTVRLSRGLSPALCDVLYRVALEAMSNARKHAQAHTVTVRLEECDGGVLLSVEDDGVGFPSPPADRDGHAGLQTMARRASAVGGRLSISAFGSGQGTVVRCWVPWSDTACSSVSR